MRLAVKRIQETAQKNWLNPRAYVVLLGIWISMHLCRDFLDCMGRPWCWEQVPRLGMFVKADLSVCLLPATDREVLPDLHTSMVGVIFQCDIWYPSKYK